MEVKIDHLPHAIKEDEFNIVTDMKSKDENLQKNTKKQTYAKVHPKPNAKHEISNSLTDKTIEDIKQIPIANNQRKTRRSINFNRFLPEETRRLKIHKKKIDTICAFVSCTGLFLTWVENDVFFNNGNKSNAICHALRTIILISCAISHYFIYRHYELELEIHKSRKIIYLNTTLLRSPLFKTYFFESIFNWIHCPPFLDFVLPNEQLGINFEISMDAYISVIMLGRLYIFFRLFEHYTFWTGERAARVCKINGFLPDSKFAIKAYLKYKSFFVLVLSLGFSIIIFGFALRTLERPYTNPHKRFNFDYLWNSFWCVVVTMATIGYGDIYPQTHLGRLVIIIASIWGIFILSLFVVTLNNTSQLTKEENKAYELLTRNDQMDISLKKDASKIIILLFRLNLAKKKKINFKKTILMRMDLKGIANRFGIKRRNKEKKIKNVKEILDDMHNEVSNELGDLIQLIQPLRKSPENISLAQESQSKINQQTVEIHENSRRLMTLLIGLNNDTCKDVKELKEITPLYDQRGILLSLQTPQTENTQTQISNENNFI